MRPCRGRRDSRPPKRSSRYRASTEQAAGRGLGFCFRGSGRCSSARTRRGSSRTRAISTRSAGRCCASSSWPCARPTSIRATCSAAKVVPAVRELASRHPIADFESASDVELALDNLTLAISREFAYDRAVTNVYSSVDEVLTLRAGVCQDFAHLFIAVARAMGVPARYVSGYIHDPRGRGVTGASHAWGEAWVPQKGWVGYDATHPVRIGEHHVRIAVGRDYSDAAPTRAVYVGSATATMNVKGRTRPLADQQPPPRT